MNRNEYKVNTNMAPQRIEKLKEINKFYVQHVGKTHLTHDLIKYLFKMYNDWFGTFEGNYTCSACVIKIFNKIKKLSDFYVAHYKNKE